MRDWLEGKDSVEAEAITLALDSGGNMNGVADPGDLITL
jgi:hypothetical protein